jgi:DNA-binding PadR family transcriptional regulator
LAAPTIPASPHALRPHKELLIAWTLMLLRDVGETYGYTLHQMLLARGISLQATSVYRWLGRFDRDGWVWSRWSEPIDGPQRHVYQLSAEGRVALLEITGLIAVMRDTYTTFLDAHAQARGGGEATGVDAATTPDLREDVAAPAEGQAADTPVTQQQPLRPHKELLVGWLLLYLEGGATYGYDLRRNLAAQRLSPDPGAVYRMLRQLEKDKWVQSRWLSPSAGPRRRFYRLTGRGRRNLDEIARLIATIRDGHDTYLQAYGEQAPDDQAHASRAAMDSFGVGLSGGSPQAGTPTG